ncbi:molybdate ABC transporter substrate-binding protein [Hoeflea sp.]|uniref:molybdate ABC transporter substrate-binding protein n=1 Tax=Hoeflea sp. TaxID=1940281 RepID=UPI001998624B|nr:molybdate ABC transporter substrate-binding protein [Hoeflea sp.]MBC7280662.1 molybdate ABC transporter substrate-binding protein [Hoeflea sp.]
MIAITRRIALAAAVCLSATLAVPARATAEDITIFAAASMKTALDAIATAWNAETGNSAVVSYAGSSALAKQIQEGAPADVFISAAVKWMDTLEESKLIKPGTRVDLLGNSIVLVAHGAEAAPVEIAPGFDLAGILGENKLAMALVDSVPAGVYGKAALTSLGVWDAVEPKVAQADNVRAALALVAAGEAPMGIVYASDAVAEPRVRIVGVFPADSHPPIVYPAAVIADSAKPEAQAFLTYLSGAKARIAFEGQGFTVLKK